MTGVCRICGCTESTPCAGGCAWTDAAQTLCSTCLDAGETAAELVRVLGITLAPSGLALTVRNFDELSPDNQAALVTIVRELVDSIRDGIAAAMSEEAIEAIRQVDAIGAFLLQHCPTEVGDDDTAADVVLRILDHNLGSRIVLPGGAAL